MKRLFIRFFANKEDGIPRNSNPLCSDANSSDVQQIAVATVGEDILEWTRLYPNGKVDFVWL